MRVPASLFSALVVPNEQFPPKIVITDYEDHKEIVIPEGDTPNNQRVDTIEYSAKTCADMGRDLWLPDPAKFVAGLLIFAQIVRVRLGAREMLEMLQHPAHADSLLLPATDNLLAHERELRAKAAADMEDFDTQDLAATRQRLADVRAVLSALTPLVTGLTALETHLENRIDGPMRVLGRRLRGFIARSQGLSVTLKPFIDYLFGDGEEAADSRRTFARRAADVEKDTLARVAQATTGATGAATGTPAGTAPGTPAPQQQPNLATPATPPHLTAGPVLPPLPPRGRTR